ncbi:MAG: hypothetical protein ACQKBU_09195, partial [Verrucomicrobiales bacterium]
GLGLFETILREDTVRFWSGLRGMSQGLGDEAAVVVDLNASFRGLPGVPQGVAEKGRFLRASWIAPVEEREVLTESWSTIDGAMRSMALNLKEAELMDFNIPLPSSSEKNDVVTWYYDAFAFSDDVKPSITVSEDWFVASSSRQQALDLVAAVESPAPEVRYGAWACLDLDVLRDYLEEALKLIDEEGESLIADEAVLSEFRSNLPVILDGL